jgi:hypothetical protein
MKTLLFMALKIIFGTISLRGGFFGFVFSTIMFLWALNDFRELFFA